MPPTQEERQVQWTVKGGGTLSSKNYKATYHAPSFLSQNDPEIVLEVDEVTINEILQSTRHKKGLWTGATRVPVRRTLAIFSCKISLYDEYKVTVSMDFGKDQKMEWIDKSSFILTISDHVEISAIQNAMLTVVNRIKSCKPQYINQATCTGMINVTGMKSAKIVPPIMQNGPLWADISFEPAKTVTPEFFSPPCKGNKEPVITPFASGPYAFPVRLFFELRSTGQIRSLAKNEHAELKKIDPNDITATIVPIR
jgi:hypothetical protein